MMPNKFIYYRRNTPVRLENVLPNGDVGRDHRGVPHTTIAVRVDGTNCRVGITRHNPNDAFNRVRSRTIAEGRRDAERDWNEANEAVRVRTARDCDGNAYPIQFEFTLPYADMKQHEIQQEILTAEFQAKHIYE